MATELSENEEKTSEQLREIVYSQALPSFCIGLLCILATIWILDGYVPSRQLTLWAWATGFMILLRLPTLVAFERRRHSNTHLTWYVITLTGVGLMWGSLVQFSAPELPLDKQVVILAMPLGVLTSAAVTLSAWLPAFHAFAWPFMISFVAILAFHAQGAYLSLVPAALCCFGFCVPVAHRFHRQTRHSLRLKIQNEQLVTDLSHQNTQLSKAHEEAEAAVFAKDAFLSRMSHELRTPMNGVMGMAQLLSDSRLNDRQKQWVSSLQLSGARLHQLINDLLDATSLATDDVVLCEESTPVTAITRSLENDYTQAFVKKGLAIAFVINELVPTTVLADRLRLNQVLRKLMDNALKFTHEGGVTLSVTTAASLSGSNAVDTVQDLLVFRISDTGVGIDNAELAAVSDLFHQSNGNSNRLYQGSGLGLSIVNSLVELMDGSMTIHSHKSRGTDVTIQIPLKPVSEPSVALPVVVERAPGSGMRHVDINLHTEEPAATIAATLRILVAEDNPVNQLVIESMLEALDCDVTMADDGVDALDMLESQSFDIIFMDCQMPECDGYEATRIARERGIETPIVAVTANAMAGDRAKCLDAGMNDYMAKPFTREALTSVLAHWTFDFNADHAYFAKAV